MLDNELSNWNNDRVISWPVIHITEVPKRIYSNGRSLRRIDELD